MADPFEADLEAMFDTPPALTDDVAFVVAVDRALRRRWLVRRAALATAGVVGGAVALSRLPDLLALDLAPAARWLGDSQALLALPYGVAGLWAAAGLAAATVVLLRSVEV